MLAPLTMQTSASQQTAHNRHIMQSLASETLSGSTLRYLPGTPWQCLYLRTDPHGHRSLRPTLVGTPPA